MSVLVKISIKPSQQKDSDFILKSSLFKAKLQSAEISDWRIRKRSIDARNTSIKLNLQIEFWLLGETRTPPQYYVPQDVQTKPEIAIIGAGPAGLYAGLRAIEVGLKPIVFERGKDVRARRRDLAASLLRSAHI